MTDKTAERTDSLKEYVAAYKRAQADFSVLIENIRIAREQLQVLEKEAHQKAKLAKSILDSLPNDVIKRHGEDFAKINDALKQDGRTSLTFDLIRKIMSDKRRGHIKSSELVKAPEFQQIGIDPKSIYNTLNYLANRGELRRVSRGRYLVVGSGVAIESSVELPKLEEDRHD